MIMGKRHINIPIFIPHQGCPNACVFCNQHTITCTQNGGASRDIRPEIESCLATIDKEKCECEIAFFGGSFTGIDRTDMIRLLETAYEYVKCGSVQSIRLSTRPDFIDKEILELLGRYGVRHIELGIQSLDDRVLEATKRGHTAEISRRACRMITERGFSLTGQMMIGLPGASPESEVETAKEIVRLGADSARIYPTVVFFDTELCEMAKRGEYTPLTNEQAAERAAKVYKVFADNGVKLLRIGLQSGEGISDDNVYGGANHSAIGEMVLGAYYYDLLCEKCRYFSENGEVIKGDIITLEVYCADGETSKVAGQKKINKKKITDCFATLGVKVDKVKIIENSNLQKNTVNVKIKAIKKLQEK